MLQPTKGNQEKTDRQRQSQTVTDSHRHGQNQGHQGHQGHHGHQAHQGHQGHQGPQGHQRHHVTKGHQGLQRYDVTRLIRVIKVIRVIRAIRVINSQKEKLYIYILVEMLQISKSWCRFLVTLYHLTELITEIRQVIKYVFFSVYL